LLLRFGAALSSDGCADERALVGVGGPLLTGAARVSFFSSSSGEESFRSARPDSRTAAGCEEDGEDRGCDADARGFDRWGAWTLTGAVTMLERAEGILVKGYE
jgi:hypothetical protein